MTYGKSDIKIIFPSYQAGYHQKPARTGTTLELMKQRYRLSMSKINSGKTKGGKCDGLTCPFLLTCTATTQGTMI
jgi:hypothetical protein